MLMAVIFHNENCGFKASTQGRLNLLWSRQRGWTWTWLSVARNDQEDWLFGRRLHVLAQVHTRMSANTSNNKPMVPHILKVTQVSVE